MTDLDKRTFAILAVGLLIGLAILVVAFNSLDRTPQTLQVPEQATFAVADIVGTPTPNPGKEFLKELEGVHEALESGQATISVDGATGAIIIRTPEPTPQPRQPGLTTFARASQNPERKRILAALAAQPISEPIYDPESRGWSSSDSYSLRSARTHGSVITTSSNPDDLVDYERLVCTKKKWGILDSAECKRVKKMRTDLYEARGQAKAEADREIAAAKAAQPGGIWPDGFGDKKYTWQMPERQQAPYNWYDLPPEVGGVWQHVWTFEKTDPDTWSAVSICPNLLWPTREDLHDGAGYLWVHGLYDSDRNRQDIFPPSGGRVVFVPGADGQARDSRGSAIFNNLEIAVHDIDEALTFYKNNGVPDVTRVAVHAWIEDGKLFQRKLEASTVGVYNMSRVDAYTKQVIQEKGWNWWQYLEESHIDYWVLEVPSPTSCN